MIRPFLSKSTAKNSFKCYSVAFGSLVFTYGELSSSALTVLITKASMLAEFFFALAMLWWEGLRALKIDISS